MVSNASTWALSTRMMPLLAILRSDVRALLGSWLVRIWLAAALALTFVLTAIAWPRLPTAPLVASLLFPWLVFPWFVVVMVLGVNPISGSQAGALADGFLSRPITRYEYLLGIWAGRVAVVLGVYLASIVPAVAIVALANRSVPADGVTVYGVLAALALVALVLVLQVSLAFLAGTVLRRALPAMVVLLFVWYPLNGLLHTFKLEAFSPIRLSQVIPTLLRQPWHAAKPDAPTDQDLEDLARQASSFLGFLSGAPSPEPPGRKRSFFEPDDVRDFSLVRVALGYGVPALLALGLATACFCRRDL